MSSTYSSELAHIRLTRPRRLYCFALKMTEMDWSSGNESSLSLFDPRDPCKEQVEGAKQKAEERSPIRGRNVEDARPRGELKELLEDVARKQRKVSEFPGGHRYRTVKYELNNHHQDTTATCPRTKHISVWK